MKTSIKIGKVYGIPIKLHFTLIFIVALIAWSVGANVLLLAESLNIPPPDITVGAQSYLLGILVALGLFLSVFIHEMAHSIVSVNSGFDVDEISLWLFGGVSKLSEIPRDPNVEIKISAVGPLSSIALAFIAFLGGTLVINDMLVFLLFYLSFINFFLAGFNLIPAFPMDGGRIVRALLAKRYSYVKATKKAANLGKVFAVIFGIVGLFVNIFLILIAFFIYIAASQEAHSVVVKEVLSSVSVQDMMSEEVKTVDPETSIEEFIAMVSEHQHTGFPVVSEDRIVGIVTLGDSKDVPRSQISTTRVKDVMETDVICVDPDDDASKVWKMMSEKKLGRFPVLKDGEMVGIITRSDLMHSFEVLREVERFKGQEV